MVKAVLLDAYGTLFDTGTGSVQAAQEILARNGREDLSPAEFYGQWKALHHRLMEELPSFRTEARLYAQGLAMLYRQYGFSRNPAEDVKVMLRYQGTRTRGECGGGVPCHPVPALCGFHNGYSPAPAGFSAGGFAFPACVHLRGIGGL